MIPDYIMERIAWLVITAICLLVWSQSDYNEAVKRDEHYCFMVEMFKQTNGESGWPDFNNNYDEVCR